VARYPEPPLRLRKDAAALVWEKPRRHAEIQGFRLYRSSESGRGYERVGGGLLTGTRYELPPGARGFYVLTSVEYSGLESRAFSNEARVGGNGVFRHFHRPAAGRIGKPMVPFFEPAATGDGYAVAITDPDLVYKQRLSEGLGGSVTMPVDIPEAGPVRILARVRGMSAMERVSYTTGWPPAGEAARGTFTIRIDGKQAGTIPIEGFSWRWVALDGGAVELAAGTVELEVATQDAGIAIDQICVTNDRAFAPRSRGQAPEELAAVPEGLRRVPPTREHEQAASASSKELRRPVKLVWNPVAAPQGVSHYNVYRSETEAFPAEAETLLGSPTGPQFDDAVEAGRTVYYRVRAVDAWGNRSSPSAALAVAVEH